MGFMKLTRRQEIMRRLGSPRHQHQCRCGRIVDKLHPVWEAERIPEDEPLTLENMSEVCRVCADQVERRNEQIQKDRLVQRRDWVRSQADMRYHAARSSNARYLAACERMRREVPEAAWGFDGGIFKR